MQADLHLHSTASDGLIAPAALADAVAAAGLGAAALTDHDTCAGFPAFAAHAAEAGVVPICGAEIAAEEGGQEVHLLSYFREMPGGAYGDLVSRLGAARQDRAREMLRRLAALGIRLDEKEVLRHERPGRPHIARALVKAGVVRDVSEAFTRLLSRGGPGYVSRYRPEARDVIAFAHHQGGLTTLAHPRRYSHLPLLELGAAGLDALEAIHPSADGPQTAELRATAARLGLLVTGGSDFHGRPDDPPLGTYAVSGEEILSLLRRLGA